MKVFFKSIAGGKLTLREGRGRTAAKSLIAVSPGVAFWFLGLGLWVFGFGVLGLGFGVWGLGSKVHG